jgi:hypothetical protein
MLALPDIFKDMTGLVLGDRNTHYSFLRLRFCIFEHGNDNDICDTIRGIFLKPFRRSSAFTTMMYLNTLIGRFRGMTHEYLTEWLPKWRQKWDRYCRLSA